MSPGDAPTVALEVNRDWKPLLLGLVERLLTATVWTGSAAEVEQAMHNVDELLYLIMNAESGLTTFTLDSSVLDGADVLA